MKKNQKSISMADAIWQILDECLHLVFKRNELGDVIFPFITLRRMDCMLADVNDKVRETNEKMKDKVDPEKLDLLLRKVAGGRRFYNTSRFTLESLLEDAANIEVNFQTYVNGYNQEVRDILAKYQFQNVVAKLNRNHLLYKLIDQVCSSSMDLSALTDMEMGDCFEEIIRLANEGNGETAGEHFTPRDAIHLMCAVLFRPHADRFKKGIIRSLYDPTCGTGGMVNIGRKFICEELCTPDTAPTIYTYGQELNETAYAVARSEALMTGADTSDIRLGDTLSDDQFPTEHFDYMMANPPYGINWTKEKEYVQAEALNPFGRFSAGTPAISDGQLLFLQHMISKMDDKNGSRIGVVTNGSPLFSGGAGSGESSIRKWILEHDWLDCIIGLPKDMFYNTPISTYIWILDNQKPAERKGKVQLIDATHLSKNMIKSLGNKRNTIEDTYNMIYDAYAANRESDICKIFRTEDFGYLVLTVEQPLRDEKGELVLKKGQKQADKSKRMTERVPLTRDAKEYFATEVLPHIDPEAWLDIPSTKMGYEINFTRYFYKYQAAESSEVIRKRLTNEESLRKMNDLFNAIFAD